MKSKENRKPTAKPGSRKKFHIPRQKLLKGAASFTYFFALCTNQVYFLAPVKCVPLAQRLYHDIFADLDAAQNYAESLKLHELQYPESIVTFLICNRQKTSLQPWYQREMEAIRLMEKTGQTYLDDSFCIFTKNHINSLKKLPTRENLAC